MRRAGDAPAMLMGLPRSARGSGAAANRSSDCEPLDNTSSAQEVSLTDTDPLDNTSSAQEVSLTDTSATAADPFARGWQTVQAIRRAVSTDEIDEPLGELTGHQNGVTSCWRRSATTVTNYYGLACQLAEIVVRFINKGRFSIEEMNRVMGVPIGCFGSEREFGLI